jgi:hypothetical protein
MSGWCRCAAGWRGDACDVRMKRPCSQRLREGGFEPYNEPLDYLAKYDIHSRCAGECDEDIGMCFCPSNTTYGRKPAAVDAPAGIPPLQRGRPMGIHCQPNVSPDGMNSSVGEMNYRDLFGSEGWCNAEAPEVKCPCYLDGVHGSECNIIAENMCLNQCNGHGECYLGWCNCHEGWFGQDCAYRTLETSWSSGFESERPWLEMHVKTPAAQDPPPSPKRKQPLIYVYELPPILNQLLLQYRLFGGSCVHRVFNWKNVTELTQNAYNLETGLHEYLLQSEHRTLDPEEADFFYIPVYPSCNAHPVLGFSDFPWFHGGPGANRAHSATNMWIEAWSWIQSHYPYWDRHGGADHIVLATHDEGSCHIPEVLRPAILLTNWGYTGYNNVSFTAYADDVFTKEYIHPVYQPEGHLSKLGSYPCYNSSKDLVVPSMWPVQKYHASPLFGSPNRNRTIFGFHKGRILPDLLTYSRGTRQKTANVSKAEDWWGKYRIYYGEGNPPGMKDISYSELLASSTFCLDFMGDGWSARFDDAVVHGCIPVIIIDDVHVGFESIIDVSLFALRIKFEDIERIPEILLAVEIEEIEKKQLAIRKVWRRYFYSGLKSYNVTVTRKLVENNVGREDLYDPCQDDAFETIVQWLGSRIID